MRKLILIMQLICVIATFTNVGYLMYISSFIRINPLEYLSFIASNFQNKVFDYSLYIGLISFFMSLILFHFYKKKWNIKYRLLILPTIILLFYFIYVSFFLTEKYFNSSAKLKRAWENNDSVYVKEYISNLYNYDVEEMTAKTYYVLSEYTNFGYGMLFYTDNGWNNVSLKEREILKYNIYTIWNEYSKSNLFMKKDCKVNFHDFFWSDKKITNSEVFKIHQILNQIADSCNHQFPK